MLNEVRIIGRATKDVEKKKVNKGYFLSFPVAVNESYKKDGKWEEKSNFFEVEMFVQNPENLEKRLRKGNLIMIIGKLKQERWEDEQGNKHSKVKIVAQRILLLKEAIQEQGKVDEEIAIDN